MPSRNNNNRIRSINRPESDLKVAPLDIQEPSAFDIEFQREESPIPIKQNRSQNRIPQLHINRMR